MPDKPSFEFLTSRQFVAWLAEQRASVAFSTYQAGKLFLLGVQPDGRLSVFNRTFNRCMGMAADRQTLVLSTLYQLWRFENSLPRGQTYQGYDACYVPQLAYTTGDLDIHDIGMVGDGKPVFVNTLFSCLAAVSNTHSFKPVWRPPFISRLAAEDRCHLNGLAMKDGTPAYVTCVSRSDAADGWRDRRTNGGCVIDVASGDAVVEGMSMPHSPRWHRGKLWVLDSGSGFLGQVDLDRGRFEPVVFCPGYARGLNFIGDFAVVGISKARQNRTFSGLALDGNLAERDVEARCGLLVIDLRSGDTVHWLRITGAIEELYDVVVIAQVVRPMAIGLRSDEIRRVISIERGDG